MFAAAAATAIVNVVAVIVVVVPLPFLLLSYFPNFQQFIHDVFPQYHTMFLDGVLKEHKSIRKKYFMSFFICYCNMQTLNITLFINYLWLLILYFTLR